MSNTRATRFWLIRHAIVEPASRAFLYGRMDVALCADSLARQGSRYHALAARLPGDAVLVITPLRRTRDTLAALIGAGYPNREATVEADLTEQDLGAWQGLPHQALPAQLVEPPHPFWPLGAGETPPGGESMEQVVHRVGAALNRLAARHAGGEVIVISHGGAIRAAIAHAAGVPARAALHFAVQNLGLSILEREGDDWRVRAVNEGADIAA